MEEARLGRGGVVVVEGAAGSGKTALLRAFRDDAGGVRVLQATGGELEREFPFGVVRQLFERAVLAAPLEQRERWLSGAAALAAPVIGAAPDLAEPVADASFATLHGLYWLTATLADDEPLLLIVDDAHWADAPSLRFLDFLARRAGELALLMVVGTRVNEPGAELELLDALSADAVVIRPRPLSADGVRALIGGDDEAVTSALDATRGNPLLIRELARSLGEEPATAASISAAVPSSLTRSVERRLARVPEDARRVARVLAVLGRDADTLAAVTGLTGEQTAQALTALRALELIEDDPPAFIHPLLQGRGGRVGHRGRARPAAPRGGRAPPAPARRRRGRGRAPARRPSARAAVGGADAPRGCAARAGRGRAGGCAQAARACLGGGRADPGERHAFELELGRAAVRAGDPRAAEYLTAAAAADGHGDRLPGRGRADRRRPVLPRRPPAGHRPAARGLRRADRPRAARPPRRPDHERDHPRPGARRAARRRRSRSSRRTPGPAVYAHLAYDAASGAATAAETLEFARRSLADRPFTRLATIEHPTPFWTIIALLAVDEAELSRAAIADAERTVERTPPASGPRSSRSCAREWMLAFGSAALAEADAREALEQWGRLPQNSVAVGARATLVRSLSLQGELDEAERELLAFPAEDTIWGHVLAMTAHVELRSAQGRLDEAIAAYEHLDANLTRLGWRRTTQGHLISRHARNLIAAGRDRRGPRPRRTRTRQRRNAAACPAMRSPP